MKKNVLNKTLASAVLLGALTLTGCAPKQHAMTPEQAQMGLFAFKGVADF